MTKHSPLTRYQQAIEQGFIAEPAQQRAVDALQACFTTLHSDTPQEARGVYLWGPVGRGKTWLMDIFYNSLQVPARRQHFHHFIGWVHQRLFEMTGTPDPLRVLARELAEEVRVLCFDELFVHDIGDATLLGRLFEVMFDEGVVMVATSNQAPQQLYEDGYNRERFLPAIAAICQHLQTVPLDGDQDHRLHAGTAHPRYWVTGADSEGKLAQAFEQWCAGEKATNEEIIINHHRFLPLKHCSKAIWLTFHELCGNARSPMDYVALCDRFSAILISEVPNLSAAAEDPQIARGTEDGVKLVNAGERLMQGLSVHDNSVRRFISLIDECYDRGVPVYIEAAVALTELYTDGGLGFPFRRTLSRLQEMQLERFG